MSGTSRYNIDIVANNKASAALGNVTKQLSQVEKGAQKTNSAFSQMKTLAVAAGAALGSLKLSQSFMQAATQFENLNVQLKFITGSASDGAKALSIVEEAASKSAFAMEDMAAAAPSLLTVSSIDELASTLEMAGDIAAATGMGFQETASQLQRAFSGGIAAADIFREKGVKSMLGFQEGVKYTAEQTEKMIRDAFENGTTSLKGATAEMAKTWDGQISMMGDAWLQFRKLTMESGLFDALKNALRGVQTFINQNKEAIDQFAVALGQTLAAGVNKLGEAVAFVVEHSGFFLGIGKALVALQLAKWIRTAMIAMRGLNIVMMANPILAVIGAVAALIGYFVGQNGLGRTIVQVQAAFDVFGGALARFGAFLKDSLGKVVGWFGDKINGMKEKLINAYNAMANFIPGMEAFEDGVANLADGIGDGLNAAMDYTTTKADEFGKALKDAMPDELVQTFEDAAEASRAAGEAYDQQKAAAAALEAEQQRLLDMQQAMSAYGPRGDANNLEEQTNNTNTLATANTNLATTVKSVEERYREFYKSTLDGAKEAIELQQFEQKALKDLFIAYDNGRITLEQFTEAQKALGISAVETNKELANSANAVVESVKSFSERYADFYQDTVDGARGAADMIIFKQQALQKLKEDLDAGKISIDTYAQGVIALGQKFSEAKTEIDDTAEKITALTDRLFPQEAALGRLKEQMAFVEQQRKLGNITDAEAIRLQGQLQVEYDKTSGKTAELAARNKELVASLAGYEDRILRIANANAAAVTANEELVTSMTRLDERLFPVQAKLARLEEDLRLVEQAYRAGLSTEDEYIARKVALRTEIAKLGPQMDQYEDRILRIANAQKASAETAKAAAEAQTRFTNDIERLNDQLFPLEAEMRRHKDNLEMIDKAYKDGLIGQEQYIKMSQKVREEMTKTGEQFTQTTEKMKDASGEFVDKFNKDFNEKLADGLVEGNLSFDTFAGMWKSTLKDLISDTLNGGSLLNDILGSLGNLFGGGGGGGNILGGILDGGFARNAVDSFSSFAGDFIGGHFARNMLYADGGHIAAGKTGIVGEAGPELVTGPAQVYSNEDSFGPGSATPVNITIQAIDTQTGTEFLLKNKRQIEGIIQGAYNRRGKQGIY